MRSSTKEIELFRSRGRLFFHLKTAGRYDEVRNSKLPPRCSALAGIAVPADASLMMHRGAESVVVCPGILTSITSDAEPAAVVGGTTSSAGNA
jgi:pyridoxal biosynthesis lyase PdxS